MGDPHGGAPPQVGVAVVIVLAIGDGIGGLALAQCRRWPVAVGARRFGGSGLDLLDSPDEPSRSSSVPASEPGLVAVMALGVVRR